MLTSTSYTIKMVSANQKMSKSPPIKKTNKKKHCWGINADCHIIASFAAGVATGSRRVKPKDILDRVS